MIYCSNCRNPMPDEAKYCSLCGTTLRLAAVGESNVDVAPPPPAPPVVAAAPAGRVKPGWALLHPLVIDNGGKVFPGTKGFDWGAFWWSGIWTFFHGQWKLGLAFFALVMLTGSIPVVGSAIGIIGAVYFGQYGFELAQIAMPRRWSSFEQLRSSQRAWAMFGLALFAIALVGSLALGMLGLMFSLMSGFGGYY